MPSKPKTRLTSDYTDRHLFHKVRGNNRHETHYRRQTLDIYLLDVPQNRL